MYRKLASIIPIIVTVFIFPSIAKADIATNLANTKIINVPLLNFNGVINYPTPKDATTGIPLTEDKLNGNNWAIIWGGKVSDGNNNYFDMRLIGNISATADSPAGLRIRAQFFDNVVKDADKFVITINGKTFTSLFGNRGGDELSANGSIGFRCSNLLDCRGWDLSRLITWNNLGVTPNKGDIWDLTATFTDTDTNISTSSWSGKIRWGDVNYEGIAGANDTKINIVVSADSNLGGNTDCGDMNYPDYFDKWGNRNFELPILMPNGSTKDYSAYAISQNEWDTSDWPCYAKQATQWNISAVPSNANITKATMTFEHFGDAGYGNCYSIDPNNNSNNATGDTIFQLYELTNPFIENNITWDNISSPRENISKTIVQPARSGCNNNGTRNPLVNPYKRVFDVTEAVKRAKQEGRNTVSVLMYTAAGQYHSGKQFWSNKGADSTGKGAIDIYYTASTSTPQTTPTPNPSINTKMDVNKDGVVNLLDVLAVLGEIMR